MIEQKRSTHQLLADYARQGPMPLDAATAGALVEGHRVDAIPHEGTQARDGSKRLSCASTTLSERDDAPRSQVTGQRHVRNHIASGKQSRSASASESEARPSRRLRLPTPGAATYLSKRETTPVTTYGGRSQSAPTRSQ